MENFDETNVESGNFFYIVNFLSNKQHISEKTLLSQIYHNYKNKQ